MYWYDCSPQILLQVLTGFEVSSRKTAGPFMSRASKPLSARRLPTSPAPPPSSLSPSRPRIMVAKATPFAARKATCRGAWARVTIGHFNTVFALQTFHRRTPSGPLTWKPGQMPALWLARPYRHAASCALSCAATT
jgi:hypothetical protein